MGKLTDDMTRVCDEIRTMRGKRQELKEELAEGHRERKVEVGRMCADFVSTQARRARETRKQLHAFLDSVRETVAGQQQELRTDLAAIRRAWEGAGASDRTPAHPARRRSRSN